MPKSAEYVKKFIDALEDAGYEPQSYSGRGMYGKSCVSLKSDPDDGRLSAWDVAKALWFDNLDHEAVLDIPAPRQDQLGLGIVLYWPSYIWPSYECDQPPKQ